MSETEEKKEEQTAHDNWMNQFKRVVLAGMGAIAIAQDEVDSFIGKMVDRGELAEQEGRKWAKEFLEKSRKQTKDTFHSIEENSLDSLEKLLSKLNIPTKKDFEELARRVDTLAQRVEELTKKHE